MHTCLRGPNNLFIEPDFPCLADEIVEPRPDMNIKDAAFTESKKCYYILLYNWAATCDFQQCGILTWIDSNEPVQPPIKTPNAVHSIAKQS